MLWIHRGGTGLDGRPCRMLQRAIEMSRGWEGARTRDFGLSRSLQPQHGIHVVSCQEDVCGTGSEY